MRIYLLLIICMAFLMPQHSSAQGDDRIDVIYLKNGTIYRGTIIEQVPNVSYKIEITGGSVILVKVEDVDKITKEAKPTHAMTREEWTGHQSRSRSRPYRGYKDKGAFMQMQLNLVYAGGGPRIIAGYKINQFAMLGLGVGIGGLVGGVNKASMGDAEPYAGFYFPFFVYYSGEILQKDITPFYAVEIGYAMANNFNGGGGYNYYYSPQPYYSLRGGVMGSAGFGVRFYRGRQFVCSLSANLDVQNSHATTYTPNQNSYAPPTTSYSSVYMLLPSFKIGLGLVR